MKTVKEINKETQKKYNKDLYQLTDLEFDEFMEDVKNAEKNDEFEHDLNEIQK